jgi:hypothetical protein
MLKDGILNIEFGWKPFLGDLATLSGLVDSVKARIAYLKKTKGRVVRIGRTVDDIDPVGIFSIPDHEFVRCYSIRTRHLGSRMDYRAGGYITHNLDFLESAIAPVIAMSSALGLNNPTKVFWNALPFSFVVDWFLNVSSHLAGISAQPVGWEVESISSSVTQTASFEMWQLNNDCFGGGGFPPRPLGIVHYRRYTRIPGLPTKDLEISSLSPKQLVLLTALLR